MVVIASRSRAELTSQILAGFGISPGASLSGLAYRGHFAEASGEAHETLDPTTALIRPEGRLTMVSTASLRSLVAETVAAGHVHVVVDLSECEFIDSSGLGALVAGLKTARQAGGDLRIARPSEQVRTVLELTNLDRVLRPAASIQGAFGRA